MKKQSSERRLVENEAVFRRYNEHVQHGFDELKKLAKEEGEEAPNLSMNLHFYCECSDENCRERIMVSMKDYHQAHLNEKQFFVIPGHEVALCEFVVRKTSKFYTVQKYLTPPRGAIKLNATTIKNV